MLTLTGRTVTGPRGTCRLSKAQTWTMARLLASTGAVVAYAVMIPRAKWGAPDKRRQTFRVALHTLRARLYEIGVDMWRWTTVQGVGVTFRA